MMQPFSIYRMDWMDIPRLLHSQHPRYSVPVVLHHSCLMYYNSSDNGIHFLSFRFWIGVWITGFLLIMVMFDLSALVRYITRFTEESFAVLISIIFIYEAFAKVFAIRKKAPVDLEHDRGIGCHCEYNVTNPNATTVYATPPTITDENLTVLPREVASFQNVTSLFHEDCLTHQDRLVVGTGCISDKECLDLGWTLTGDSCSIFPVPDVFLLSLFLFFGTFGLAITLRNFRTSRFFAAIVSHLNLILFYAYYQLSFICFPFLFYFTAYQGRSLPSSFLGVKINPAVLGSSSRKSENVNDYRETCVKLLTHLPKTFLLSLKIFEIISSGWQLQESEWKFARNT